jgi:hypothetical protein
MGANNSLELKRAEQSFLSSQRKAGAAKKKGRPTKDALIQKALRDNSTAFFKRVLDDESEEKLWKMFITGKAEQLNEHGEVVRDSDGRPFLIDIELNAISWNAFKQMVAYKRGMPAIKVEKDEGAGQITVNFNVMGASQKDMTERVRELGLLPQNTPQNV